MSTPSKICATTTFLVLHACSAKPADIRWDEPPVPITSTAPVQLKARVVSADGEAIPETTVNYALSPRDIADITPDGVLVCGKAGAVTVTFSAGELVRSVDLLCALVAKIEVPAKVELVVGDEAQPILAKALDADGKVIPNVPIRIESQDPSLIGVHSGGLVGNTSGSTKLTVSAGTMSVEVPVRVIDIGTMEVSDTFMLFMGGKPKPLTANVRTIDGQLLRNYPLRAEIADPNIAVVEEGKLKAQAFGVSTLTLHAGRASRSVKVAVAETLAPVAVNIPDGGTQSVPFSPGVYVIAGDIAASDGSRYGVTATWQGASCTGSRETQTLKLLCDTSTAATLVLENPTSFGLGPAARGTLVVVHSPMPIPDELDLAD